jgi:hypothetical protein
VARSGGTIKNKKNKTKETINAESSVIHFRSLFVSVVFVRPPPCNLFRRESTSENTKI